jgi:predicted nucleic acid-binding protein
VLLKEAIERMTKRGIWLSERLIASVLRQAGEA